MPNTQSYSSQESVPRVVEWDDRTYSGFPPLPNLLAGQAGTFNQTIPTTTPATQTPATDSRADQASGTTVDWRAELKARYRAMPRTSWFKAAHEGRSLGGSVKIS
jgi:hypothetical protein